MTREADTTTTTRSPSTKESVTTCSCASFVGTAAGNIEESQGLHLVVQEVAAAE